MKAITLFILLLSLFPFRSAFGESKKAEATAPAPNKSATGEEMVPPSDDEEDGNEKANVREVPEGWIPNYRYPKKVESELFSFNLGANIIGPQASLNILVAKRLSIGVMPFYFKYRFEGIESEHIGGMLTVSAYQVDDLMGTWVFAGVGASQSKSRFLDGRASGTQPAVMATAAVGYRWKWGGFNAGVAVGGTYYEQIHVTGFRYRVGVLYPAVLYDIGFSW